MARAASGVLRRGQAALIAGEAREAVRLCSVAVERRPSFWPAHAWLGLALSEEGDEAGALEELAAAVERAPRSAVPWLFKGRVLIDHGHYGDAREALEIALERAPSNHHVPGYLALARWTADDDPRTPPPDEPRSDVVAYGADLWGRWLLIVEERFPGGPGMDFPSGREAPRSAVDRLARWRGARMRRKAEEAAEGGSVQRAAALLDAAEALWPAEPEALELRVALHARSAEGLLDKIGTDPGDVDLRLEAAEDLVEAGDPAGALAVLEPVAGLVESLDAGRLSWNAGLAMSSGRALLDHGDLDEAETHLARAVALLPTEVEPCYFHGVVQLRLGHRVAARRAFIDVCRLDGEIGPMRLRELGQACSPP